ncbi:hypothetical protein WMF28_27065 [Sorangium sp. So ce590]|uniref:hypothetical protein n=1 Tax=Sorangium sp. So ce590 TaxID=3133317 RepID=UPI003F6056D7
MDRCDTQPSPDRKVALRNHLRRWAGQGAKAITQRPEVLLFEVLDDGIVVLGVSAYWQQIIEGVIIVAAVSVDIRKCLRER